MKHTIIVASIVLLAILAIGAGVREYAVKDVESRGGFVGTTLLNQKYKADNAARKDVNMRIANSGQYLSDWIYMDNADTNLVAVAYVTAGTQYNLGVVMQFGVNGIACDTVALDSLKATSSAGAVIVAGDWDSLYVGKAFYGNIPNEKAPNCVRFRIRAGNARNASDSSVYIEVGLKRRPLFVRS